MIACDDHGIEPCGKIHAHQHWVVHHKLLANMSPFTSGISKAASDYGSDFDEDGEAQLSQLLDDIEVRHRAQSQPLVLEGIEEYASTPRFAVVPVASGPQNRGAGGIQKSVEVDLDSQGFHTIPGMRLFVVYIGLQFG